MQLYDKLRQLQEIPHAFDMWKEYRKDVTKYILQNTSEGDVISIFGVGASNDIDIKHLLDYQRKVILIDKNETAVQQALLQYRLKENPNLSVRIYDFLGIDTTDYYAYTEALAKYIETYEIGDDLPEVGYFASEFVRRYTDSFFDIQNFDDLMVCDYAVVIGVYSQFLSMFNWILHVLMQKVKVLVKDVDCFDSMTLKLIRHFNTILLRSVNKGIIIGYETKRVGRSGVIAGAYHAEIDFQERLLEKEVLQSSNMKLIWPFNIQEDIIYSVNLETYKYLNN